MSELTDCSIALQIGLDPIIDLSIFGFYLVKSDDLLAANVKDTNIVITDFPDEHGVVAYVPPTPKLAPFDYTISLICYGELYTSNQKITQFYASLLGKRIIIYNNFKGVSLSGYAKGYKAGTFYRSEKDVVIFDIIFYIDKPQDCNFNTSIVPVFTTYLDGGNASSIYPTMIQDGGNASSN